MQPNDPVTIVLSVLGLGLIAILASWIPAVRAARLNPLQTLAKSNSPQRTLITQSGRALHVLRGTTDLWLEAGGP